MTHLKLTEFYKNFVKHLNVQELVAIHTKTDYNGFIPLFLFPVIELIKSNKYNYKK